MVKLFIAMPCMRSVCVQTVQSLLGLDTKGMDVAYGFSDNSLVYDARNKLLANAVERKSDLILWMDSDMVVPADALKTLAENISEEKQFVTGFYNTRQSPRKPMIVSDLGFKAKDGYIECSSETYWDHPYGTFEIAGCGFGLCLMTGEMARHMFEKYGAPFTHLSGFGEDFSFCIRARED